MEIKILFTDQPYGFQPQKNYIFRALKKRFDVVFSNQPEFVFYGPFGTDFLRYHGAVRIFMASEPVYPNFNDCDYAIGTLDLTVPGRYFKAPPYTDYGEDELWEAMLRRHTADPATSDRKFCNFIYSNATNGEGAQKRIDFCRMLTAYKTVDCPGKVMNNMRSKLDDRYKQMKRGNEQGFNDKWVWSKLEFLKNYKFTIAFENTCLPGWTTEKLIHPFMASSIPIYWGDPDVGRYFNEKAFINANSGDFEAVIRRVRELDTDRDAYLEMLAQPPLASTYPLHWKDDLETFLSEIIQRGGTGYEKNPMGFTAVSAQDYKGLCLRGKIGIKKILDDTASNIAAWAHYKIYKDGD